MKTSEILDLDCKIEQNKETVNQFLFKVKPVTKLLQKNKHTTRGLIPLEILEQALHGICKKYEYYTQPIWTLTEPDGFKMYSRGITKNQHARLWIGNVYGITLWELTAKTIIKIYADILVNKKRTEQGE